MKKIILSSILSVAIVYASEQIPTESTIDALTIKINVLNKKVKKLEANSNHQKELDELYEIVDSVETKTFKDKISISPELRLRVDNFSYSDTHLAYKNGLNYKPHVSTRFRLNMLTEFNEDIRFYGRLLTSKSTQSNERICMLSPQTKGIISKVKNTEMVTEFDRAYFDYYLNKKGSIPLILTAGILPTTGGSSSHFIENTPRKSVFPSIIFDSNIMGTIISANFSSQFGLDNSYLRLIIGKAYTLDEKHFHYQCNRENIGNLDNYGLFFETNFSLFGGRTLLLSGINFAQNIKAKPRLGNDTLTGLDTTSDLEDLNKFIADYVPEQDQILGDIINASVGLESKGIFNSNTNIFAHFALSDPHKNGNSVDFSGQPGVYNTGDYVKGSLIDKVGLASFIGIQHNLKDIKTLIGFEHNYGSQYWWSVTQGSEDVFNKLANRGNTYEAYANYQFNRFLNFRLGYMLVHEKYAGSGWHFAKNGTPIAKDGTQKNYYFILNGYF